MDRTFHAHLSEEEMRKFLNKDEKDGLFTSIDGSKIQDFGFEVTPPENFEFPENYPKCCKFHKHINKRTRKWFNKFPNCCDRHKKLSENYWFKKEDYIQRPSKVINCLAYAEFHVDKTINDDNWYKDITDYIEYILHSFGTPSIGSNLFWISIKHQIEYGKFNGTLLPEEKRKRLIEFFEAKEKPANKEFTDLNILHSIFQKWLKSFPNLFFFDKLKARFLGKFPINLVLYEPRYNPYLGISFMKAKTKSELVEILINITRKLLSNIDTARLVEQRKIKEIQKYKFDLINEKHRLNQQSLYIKYSKGEKKYIKIIKEWLRNEKLYFDDVQDFFQKNNLIGIGDKLDDIQNSLHKIEQGLDKFDFLISELTEIQQHSLKTILLNFKDIDETLFKIDWDNKFIQRELRDISLILEKLNVGKAEQLLIKKELEEIGDVSVKHKLKFVLPLLFLKYESELEFSNKKNIPKSWKELKKLIFK